MNTRSDKHSDKPSGGVNVYTFPNGFRVVYESPSTHLETTHLNLYCRAGSAFEPEGLRGVSHFIEHMCFKGTRDLPTSMDILTEYDKIGADLTAYTEKQYTCYETRYHRKYTKRCIDVLSDMLLNSTFDRDEYAKEMAVVIEENARNTTDYEEMARDAVNASLYRGSVYAHPVDSMKFHKTPDVWAYTDVVEFYRRYYVPNNMLMSVVSSVPFRTILRYVRESYFVKSTSRELPVLNAVPRKSQQGVALTVRRIPHIRMCYITVGIRTCSEDRHVLYLLKAILGGGMSSRLFSVLREQNGLTYSSDVDTHYYEDSGDMTFETETDTERLLVNTLSKRRTRKAGIRKPPKPKKGVLPILMDILSDLVNRGVLQKEVDQAKKYLEGKRQLDVEDSTVQVEHNGESVFLHNQETVVPYDQVFRRHIRPITRANINAAIRKYFVEDNISVSIVGGNLPSDDVLRRMVLPKKIS